MNIFIPLMVLGVMYWFSYTSNPSFTMYYADWCPACKRVLPSFQAFKIPGVSIRWVEQKWSTVKVAAFPTFIYTAADGTTEVYTGARNPESWSAYLQSKIATHD
jgi:hypothetical protein